MTPKRKAEMKMKVIKTVQLPEGKVEVVSEKEPMAVLVEQEKLVVRMNPNFWNPKYSVLLNFCKNGIKLGEAAAHPPISGWRSGSISYAKSGVAVVKVGDILETGVDWEKVQFVRPDHKICRNEARQIREKDILICRSGEGGSGRAKLCLVWDVPFKAFVHGHVYRVWFKEKRFATAWAIALKTRYGRLQVERYTSGVGSPELDQEDLSEFWLPIFKEQIAKALEQEYEFVAYFHNLRRFDLASGLLKSLIYQVEEIIEGTRSAVTPLIPFLTLNELYSNRFTQLQKSLLKEYEKIGKAWKKMCQDPRGEWPSEFVNAVRGLLYQVEEIHDGKRDRIDPVLA